MVRNDDGLGCSSENDRKVRVWRGGEADVEW